MSKAKPLDARTLRAVARWHDNQCENAQANAADSSANGNYFAYEHANGESDAHQRSANYVRDQARTLERKAKASKTKAGK